MWEQIAEGTMAELKDASTYEDRVGEGQRGCLQINCRYPIPPHEGTRLQSVLDALGVAEAKVGVSGSTLSVTYRKGFAWLPVIVAAILGIVLLSVLIASWLLFREVEEGVQPWIVAGGILGMLIIAYIVYKVRW